MACGTWANTDAYTAIKINRLKDLFISFFLGNGEFTKFPDLLLSIAAKVEEIEVMCQ